MLLSLKLFSFHRVEQPSPVTLKLRILAVVCPKQLFSLALRMGCSLQLIAGGISVLPTHATWDGERNGDDYPASYISKFIAFDHTMPSDAIELSIVRTAGTASLWAIAALRSTMHSSPQ